MLKNQYYQTRRHYRYFSLSCSQGQEGNGGIHSFEFCIIASKKGVHKSAVKRNFAKRRLRAALKNVLKSEAWLHECTSGAQFQNNAVTTQMFKIKIFAHKEILVCPFEDLNHTLEKSLNTYLP